MSASTSRFRSHLTLALCTLLHGFTHAYGAMLVPLYLLIVRDLKLDGVNAASLIVTIYGLVYCLGSYPAGVLADRLDRKWLLGIGLIGNAIAIVGMGLTRHYEVLLALSVLAGLFGTLFHPTANALVPAHFPRNPGMAIGLLGIGSGIGFFVGPQYAGWRADALAWHWGSMANWQRPCIELGVAGVAFGVLFLIVASETRHRRGRQSNAPAAQTMALDATLPDRLAIESVTVITVPHAPHPMMGGVLRRKVVAIAAVLCWRDFAGVASLTLASIYLQKAHHMGVHRTGLIIGLMMLIGVVANPLAVWLSSGAKRLTGLSGVLVGGGLVLMTVPYWSMAWVLVPLCLFQACQLGSYAMSDAAMLERVDPIVRGRVVGVFLTLAGTLASLGPWAMGFWTDLIGPRAATTGGYILPFAVIGTLMALSALSTPLIARLGPAHTGAIHRADTMAPTTAAEPV